MATTKKATATKRKTTIREAKLKRSKPKLRFAALIRVSTEKQERKGESLTTQDTQIVQAVAQIGGEIVTRYAGQEHGTPGWEREQLDQLLADASRKPRPFDAVIVADPSRWSRDNVRNETGLAILRENGVRFFTLQSEHDLNNDQARLFLTMSAVLNGYSARVSARKSLENRIARAKRCGAPTGGSKPYGRIWDKRSETWSIDKDAQKTIKEIARRYIKGESMTDLADEFHCTNVFIHKVLTTRCGDEWTQTFHSDSLGIHEEVVCKVPRLLPESTIKQIAERCAANKTWGHKPLKHKYLLSRMIFCDECGSALSGQSAGSGYNYYRPWRQCKHIRGWVPAQALDAIVLRSLFETFGNPAAVERAIEKATPDHDEINAMFERRERIIKDLDSARKGRDRLLEKLSMDDISDDDFDRLNAASKAKMSKLEGQLEKLDKELTNKPDPQAIKDTAKLVTGRIIKYSNLETYLANNRPIEDMPWEDQRALVQKVFGGKSPDGERLGVYLKPHPTKKRTWTFEMRGNFIKFIDGRQFSKCGIVDSESINGVDTVFVTKVDGA